MTYESRTFGGARSARTEGVRMLGARKIIHSNVLRSAVSMLRGSDSMARLEGGRGVQVVGFCRLENDAVPKKRIRIWAMRNEMKVTLVPPPREPPR